jgi:hypothetical protein
MYGIMQTDIFPEETFKEILSSRNEFLSQRSPGR